MHYQYVFKRHMHGYMTKLNKDLQLAEVGTNRCVCVDINYGIILLLNSRHKKKIRIRTDESITKES
jgi:hypothetical protein